MLNFLYSRFLHVKLMLLLGLLATACLTAGYSRRLDAWYQPGRQGQQISPLSPLSTPGQPGNTQQPSAGPGHRRAVLKRDDISTNVYVAGIVFVGLLVTAGIVFVRGR